MNLCKKTSIIRMIISTLILAVTLILVGDSVVSFAETEGITLHVLARAPWPVSKEAANYEKITGVKVNIELHPYLTLQQKVFAELASRGGHYDIFFIDVPWVPQLIHHLEPLTPYIIDPQIGDPERLNIKDFVPSVFLDTSVYDLSKPHRRPPFIDPINIQTLKKEGFDVMGIPVQPNVLVMAYRKDLFDNPSYKKEFKQKYGRELTVPRTWEEFIEVAKFFTRDTDGDGEIDLYGTTLMAKRHESSFCDFKTLLASFGGRLFNENMRAAFNSSEGVAALELYNDLINKYKVTPPGVLTYTWEEARTAFKSGLTAMTMNYSPVEGPPGSEIGYAKVPGKKMPDGTINYGPHFGTWQLSINKYSKHKKAAYKFIEWITSAEVLIKYPDKTRFMGIRRSLSNNPKVIEAAPEYYRAYWGSLEVGVGRPRITVYSRVSETVQIAISKVLLGEATAKDALDEAARKVNKIMVQAGY